MVDVFRLLHQKEDLGRSTNLPRKTELNSHESERDDEIPQAKVTFLPSKDLHGVWKS